MGKILATFILVFMLVPLMVKSADPFVEMSFREADLVDVLRGIGDIAGKNVIICSKVKGTVTVHLKNISFLEAWEGLIYAHGLSYMEKENIFLVGYPETIDNLKFEEEIIVLELEGASPTETKNWVREIFPEVKVAFDNYKSSMIFSGRKEQLENLQRAILLLDRPPEEEEIKVLRIKHFPLEDSTRIISKLFPDLVVIGQKERKKVVIKGPWEEIARAKKFLQEIDTPLPEKELIIKELKYGKPEILRPLLKELFPRAEIKKDKRLNRLFIRSKPEILEEIILVLEEMDQPRDLVLVEFQVEEISSHFFREKGFNLGEGGGIGLFKKDMGFQGVGVNINLKKVLGFLEEEGISETLARPSLTTLDGITGRLHIGDRIPIRGERINKEEPKEIRYLQTGIIISFTPRVSGDNYITLEVKPEVSNVGEELTDGFPRIRTREAETVVRVKSGETFILGGLFQVQDRETNKDLPWFRNLPLLGHLFSSKKEDRLATELVIFITPRIIKKGEGKTEKNQEEFNKIRIFK